MSVNVLRLVFNSEDAARLFSERCVGIVSSVQAGVEVTIVGCEDAALRADLILAASTIGGTAVPERSRFVQ